MSIHFADKKELLKVAKAVKDFNFTYGNGEGKGNGYFYLHRDIIYNFNLNLHDDKGKLCTASMCTKALNVYLYLKAKRHESNNGTNKDFKEELEYSCYSSIETIANVTRIRLKTVYEILDILALNGYIVRKIQLSEVSGKPKYFFYVLDYPNKALVEMLKDNKISHE